MSVMYTGLDGDSSDFSDSSENDFADSEEPSHDVPPYHPKKRGKVGRKVFSLTDSQKRKLLPTSSTSIFSVMLQQSKARDRSKQVHHLEHTRSSYPPTAPCQATQPEIKCNQTSFRRGSTGNLLEKKKYAFSAISSPGKTNSRVSLPSISPSPHAGKWTNFEDRKEEPRRSRSFWSRKEREKTVNSSLYSEYDLDVIPRHDSTRKTKQLITFSNTDKTDIEFIEFARDFALACSRKPMFDLLNENQYAWYRRKSVAPGSLLSNNQYISNCHNTPVTPNSYYRTQKSPTLTPTQPEGHVVGDILAFITNTMRYFDNPDLSDVIIVVGEHRFYSHKFALASQSDVFRDMMIVSDRCTGCPDFQKELELDESKDCQKVFGQFLRFFYCGKISFTSDTALPLLVLAAKYKVEALRSACDAFIANMIEDGDLKSAIKWLKYATRYHLNDLSTKCVDGAISDNIEELIDSPEWALLPVECMEAILASSCLLVADEYFVFEALQRWVMSRRKSISDDQLSEELRKVLPNIRFSQMHSGQLLAVEESPVGMHWSNELRSYLGDAYRYQILARECPDFQDPQYLPRDYTDKQWCSTMHFNPTRNKRTSPSVTFDNGKWEIQPRRYYDTVNVVIILKKPLVSDIKVCISILIYKRNGDIQMRLRRKACVLRSGDLSPRSKANDSNANLSPRSVSSFHGGTVTGNVGSNTQKPTYTPHNKLHGPNNGQEYYAIDNIVSDADFQMALSQSGPAGIKIGVIIRTWNM